MKDNMENMNKEHHEISLKEKILGRIKSERITMRPKWHFILKASLGVLGILIALLAIVYLVSFVYFVLRVTGVLFVGSFGFHALGPFLFSLPWVLILASVAFVIVLEVLIRKYSFAYRTSILYSFVGIVVFVVIASALFVRAGFHERVFRFVRERNDSLVSPFYRGFTMHHFEDIHPGIISTSTSEGFLIRNSEGETLRVVVTPETRFPLGFNLTEGDSIVVLGKRIGDKIEAFGIRGIPSDEEPRMMRSNGWHAPEAPSVR